MATLVLLLGATLVAAAPRPRQAPSIENVLLFDSPATSSLVISQDVYAYTTTLDLTPISDFIQDTADTLGIDIGQDELSRAVDRFTLFGTDGSAGVELTVGCGEDGLALTPTSEKPDWGLARSVGSLEGSCQSSEETFEVKVVGTEFSATVYPFTDDGFGVISDIDDTIKITGTELLDVASNTLFALPEPIPGMPELYASLSTSLTKDFHYVTGSPYQLYPFLHDFLLDQYPTAAGPITTKNLTLEDISGLWDFLFDDDGTKMYKIAEVARIHNLFPKKTFLTVGDSSQADPEVYAESYRTFGGEAIACIWIHLVDGGDNSDERFAEAFDGVPVEKWRTYTTEEIPSLASIDVAGGSC